VTAVGASAGQAGGTGPAAWMTCVRDGREHAIRDSDFAAGIGDGFYRAACGHLVMPRALASPCGVRCAACVANLTPRTALAAGGSHRPSRRCRRPVLGWVPGARGAR